MSEINLEKEEENTINTSSKPVSKGVVININLLGYQAREELEKSSAGFKIGKSVIITLALLGIAILSNVVSYIVMSNFRDLEAAEKIKLTARKTELDSKTKELANITAERDVTKRKKDVLLWASGNSMKWSALLEEIRGRIPSNLWVDKIDITDALQVSITGQTFDHKTVAIFLASIQNSPMFSSVVLDFTKKSSTIKVNDLNNPVQSLSDDKDETSIKKIPATNEDRIAKSEAKFSIRATVVVPLSK
ncbi:MAG: PilN domain-containing protein [Cyanobacteriota bacterium]